ncbi:MAG: 4Fe-4S ferredoxin, partial [Candidatus Bathyarchaeota archaeon]
MRDDAYKLLAEVLDRLPNGFPRTRSGVEIEILKRIFSHEEAYITSKMERKHEQFDVIAKRAQRPAEQVKVQLIAMAKRGLVESDSSREAFRLQPWAIGIYEAQLDQMDHSFAHLVEEYFAQGGAEGIMKPFPALHRVVPAQSATKSEWILPYDDV